MDNIGSSKIETPEKRNPTPQDLEELQIRVDNLGIGSFNHRINNDMNALLWTIEEAKDNGWTDKLRNRWEEIVKKINLIIVQAKIDQAKEKGLL